MTEVEFSDKYNPLFYLLDAREEYKNGNQEYKNEAGVEIVLVSGGRDSGKTFALGCLLATAADSYNHRILYTRYTMTSTGNSITRALDNRLELLELTESFDFANNDYTAKKGKGLISVTGQKTSSGQQSAKLKSIEDYSIFVTEEGEELQDFDEWEKIKRSIRANDVQALSIIVFNPPTKDHMLYTNFYQGVPDGFNGIIGNVMYIHTTYIDNGKENMAPHNWNEYERLRGVYECYLLNPDTKDKKIMKEAKNYKNTVLGAFRDIAEGVIFDYEIAEFNPDNLSVIYGMDFGFNDPTTCIAVAIDNKSKKVYAKEIFYKSGVLAEDVYSHIYEQVGKSLILGDAAKIDDIARLQNMGLNIEKCFKGGGLNGSSILAGIKAMKKFDLIIDKDSEHLIHELNNYCWDVRKVETPIDKHNHALDALRYVVYDNEINAPSSICFA
jgi:phage terminase large subunit